jgi:predicted MFS family arabinose efflux permease
LVAAIATTTIFMICISGRFVPAMAMMTGSIESRYRGGFMSMNSSVQQFSSGVAAYVSGQIIAQSPGGQITHFPMVGLLSVSCALASIYLARFLRMTEGKAMDGGPPQAAPPLSLTV